MNGGPSGISIGASWNKELALRRAQYMGAEFKAKGANVALGPVVGPIGKAIEAVVQDLANTKMLIFLHRQSRGGRA